MSEPREVWLCSICGYCPGNRASWCDCGCGSDYRRMERVEGLAAIVIAELWQQAQR